MGEVGGESACLGECLQAASWFGKVGVVARVFPGEGIANGIVVDWCL